MVGGERGKGRRKEHRIQWDVPYFTYTIINFPQNDCGLCLKKKKKKFAGHLDNSVC